MCKKKKNQHTNGSVKHIQNKYLPVCKDKGGFTDSGKCKLSVSLSKICRASFSLSSYLEMEYKYKKCVV